MFLIILMMRAIHKHYMTRTRELATRTPLDPNLIIHTVLVPISSVNRVAQQTLAYARSISDNVTAIHISDEEDDIQEFRANWSKLELPIPLIIIESPYRAIGRPASQIHRRGRQTGSNDTLTVVLPEFIARHWWEHLLHNQPRSV